MFRKSLSVLLVIMLLSFQTIIPVSVSAQEVDITDERANSDLVETGGYTIAGNGTGGLYLDINNDPYAYFSRKSWGQNAYGTEGCAWFASARAYQITGKDSPIFSGSTWYNTQYSNYGYTRGKTIRAKALVCYSGHIAVIEAVDGNSVLLSEGGTYYSDSSHGYCVIRYTTVSAVEDSGFLGYVYLGESDDKTGPSYDDFHIGEIQSNQFTVMAHVTDPSGIREVKYAVWTENNGQDDIKWYDSHCTDGNDYYWARISFSDHKGEKGKYIIHMYAYDNAGNLTNPGISYNFNSTGPAYSDFHVGEFREGAFTILAKVTDINGISSVRYAVWTENNGQDDLKWYDGNCTDGNDYYWARVNFADHKDEKGKYIIHMYAYDTAGKLTNPGITFVFPETGPTVTNVNVSNISSAGYTITCNVSADVGVSRVQFPTWTEKDGQDDLVSEWWTNKDVRGTINENTVTFRVKTSEHNRETGKYITHLYAYDTLGTATKVEIPAVDVTNPISNVSVSDIDVSGFTITFDIDTDWGPITKAECATWTDENGQDDLIWHQGSYSNGKASIRILTKDHNNDISGMYITHIYIWDNSSHSAAVNQRAFPCLKFNYSDALTNPTEPPTTPPPTEPKIIKLGDVDGDGVVSVIDATAIQKVRASIPVNCFNETAADVDNDSVVSVIDATYIQKWLAHIDIPYDIGAQIV